MDGALNNAPDIDSEPKQGERIEKTKRPDISDEEAMLRYELQQMSFFMPGWTPEVIEVMVRQHMEKKQNA